MSTLPRRSLLRGALTALTALALGCSSAPTPTPTPTPHRVVVVGAGLAGLTAALDLRDAGWEVVVLEARDRVGGRVHTLRTPFGEGLHAEGGGESIDDNHGAILALVKRYGLSVEKRPVDKEVNGATYASGKRWTTEAYISQKASIIDEYAQFEEAIAKLGEGLDPEHPEDFPGAKALDQTPFANFIVEQKLGPEAGLLVRIQSRGSYNSEPEDVSLLFVAQQEAAAFGVADAAAETKRITGGNSLLPEAMAADLGAVISLNSPVTTIAESAAGVTVTAGSRVVTADFAVVAIPTPPLRAIAFEPPLPAALAAAIAEVGLGQAVKVVTEYDARFWEGLGLDGFTSTDLPFGIGWSPTDSYSSAHGLLSQFITGNPARDAATLDDVTRIATFQAQLDTVYPEGVAHKTTHAATVAWANEPFTGGGYTVYRPGQLARFWPAFRAGTPRLRFAGEHTEALAGYMESAVRSGHRVAKEIGAPGT